MLDQTIVVGPFQCNCRLLVCEETGAAVLIDPGDEAERILKTLRAVKLPNDRSLDVRFLLHTHAHLDHIGATRAVRTDLTAAAICLHRDDEPLYRQLKMQGGLFGLSYDDPLPVERYLEDEEEFQAGSLAFSVVHTPGHSPGSICFRLHENRGAGVAESLFTGDTLFQGSVGRTDLWGGDSDRLLQSIRRRLLILDDETRVCPGHGAESSIGIEKRANPFLN